MAARARAFGARSWPARGAGLLGRCRGARRAALPLLVCWAVLAALLWRDQAPGSALVAGGEGLAAAAAPESAADASAYRKMAGLYLSYVASLMVCMPGSSTFDYAAGYAYGFRRGVVFVALAKATAALLTFALVRSLRDTKVVEHLRTRSARRRGTTDCSARTRWTKRIQKGVQTDCFRFCLLARLAPLQASFVNYVLSMSDVPFSTYVVASLLGMLPPICNNVYTGVAARAVQDTVVGGSGRGGAMGLLGVFLVALSMFASAGLVKQLAGGSLEGSDGANGAGEHSTEGSASSTDVEAGAGRS